MEIKFYMQCHANYVAQHCDMNAVIQHNEHIRTFTGIENVLLIVIFRVLTSETW